MDNVFYHDKQDYSRARSFGKAAAEAAFPLGGIGTGNISVGARGELRDWEIFNKPEKGMKPPYIFFAMWAKKQGRVPVTDEKGLLLCSWPRGGRPKLPFVYCDEVWTGIEYQVAAHLIYEGFVDEGLTLAESVRERHDGYKRNPWNEVECGNHYVRAMASWGVLIALSGFKADLPQKRIIFRPMAKHGDFKCFFSCDAAWGVFTRRQTDTGYVCETEVLYGIDILIYEPVGGK